MHVRRWIYAASGVTAVAAVAAFVGHRRWLAASDAAAAVLRSHESPPLPSYAASDLAGLPAPVARYFTRVLRDGQPIITSARIQWDGEFNMGRPGHDSWRPFTAVQEFVPGAPGFVWDATIALPAGVPVYVRDSFIDGRAVMRGAVFGLVPVVGTEGTPTLASGALQRYLGEASWLPTALLPRQGVSWTAIDAHRARATLSAGDTTVSLDFRFDADGRNLSVFTPERFYDDGSGAPVARPWQATHLAFDERDGVLVVTESRAEWHLPSGTFVYWRGRPTSIVYRYGAGPR